MDKQEMLTLCLQYGLNLLQQKADSPDMILDFINHIYEQPEVILYEQDEVPDTPPWAVSCKAKGYWLGLFETKKEAEQFAIDFGLPVDEEG